MADQFGAGTEFRKLVSNFAAPVIQAAVNPEQYILARAQHAGTQAGMNAAPGVHDFLSGAFGLPRPSVTVPLPAATPAKTAPQAPAAAAAGGGKAPAAAAGKAAVDPLAALGNLSFRQLLTLSQASENLQPKGQAKTPSATDEAGASLAAIYNQQFKQSLDAAGKDPAKQQAAVDAFEKKMLPIALKGNTANEYIYGNQ